MRTRHCPTLSTGLTEPPNGASLCPGQCRYRVHCVIRYPSLTHLFTYGEGTPGPQEYATPRLVDPQVALDIANFIGER